MPSSSLTWLLDVPVPVLPDAPVEIPDQNNYTDAEVSTAVSKLVQGAIRRPYGILGERKTGTTFDDTMDAAAGVFILTPESPFYVVLLGARRLFDAVSGVITEAVDLLAAVEATGRRVKPLTSLTSLGNARTALLALENAAAARSSAFEDVEEAPAFQRYERHTDRFLDEAASNIRVGTNIVQTPQEARKSLGNLVSAITESYQDVLRRVRLLQGGIDNYNSLNLSSLLAQGVMSRARGVLEDRIEQLETLTPSQRLEHLRDTALDVLAGKAVVKGFGSLTRSGEFVVLDGVAVSFTDADHPGTAAVVESSLLDPFIIVAGADQLTFTLDGGPATLTIPIQRSFLARLDGTAREPFNIVVNVNDQLDVDVLDAGDVDVVFTPGAARTAAQICDDFNAAVGSEPVVAETFLAPEKFVGVVNVTGTDPNMVFTSIGGSASFVTLGVAVGDGLIVQTGTMAQVYFIVSARTATTISATRSGPGTGVVEAGVTISVGPPGRFVRFRIADGDEVASLTISRSLRIDDDTGDPAAVTLGFLPNMEVASRRTRAEDVANSVNASAASSVAGVPRVVATVEFVPSTFQGTNTLTGRSEPGDASKVVSTLYRVRDAVSTAAGPSPAIFAVSGAASAGVVVGDILTIRGSIDAGDVGLRGTITVVSDTEVRATMNGSVTLTTGLDLEFGRDIDINKEQVVRVLSPSPLEGDYRVLDDAVNRSEMVLERPLPLFTGQGGQGITFNFQVGAYRVDFASTTTTTSSQLQMSGTAASRFFLSPPAIDIGSTPFVLLPSDPKVLGVGDRFEVYSGQYNEPELSFAIIGFERGQQLIELDGQLPNSFLELDLSTNVPTPFARIRRVARNNYDVFKVQLGLWLDLSVNGSNYFRDLNRFLNPLIVNDNPTLSAVNTAKTHVQSLISALQQLQLVLNSYGVDPVPQVDTLIDSFLSRGSDRAVDTLLEARFTEFFGYNSEEVSYIGNALERLRDVSRLDLPVRRTARKEVIDQELTLSSYEDPDFEFDQSDTQDVNEPDIPGQFLDVPGSNF